MAKADGPYADKKKTQSGPFYQTSQAEDVTNPRDLGADRSSAPGREDPARLRDFSEQQRPPKPFPGKVSGLFGYNPYANAGGLAEYLANSNELAGPQAMLSSGYEPFDPEDL